MKRNLEESPFKAIRVILSCKTLEQLEVAWRYIELMSRKFEYKNDIGNKIQFLSIMSNIHMNRMKELEEESNNVKSGM